MDEQRWFDYEVLDARGRRVGTVEALWRDDQTRRPEFLGVKTGWILGKIHVVPLGGATVDDANRRVTLLFDEDRVREAPSFDEDEHISRADQLGLYRHYGISPRHSLVGSPAQEGFVPPQGRERDLDEEGPRILRLERNEVHIGPVARIGPEHDDVRR